MNSISERHVVFLICLCYNVHVVILLLLLSKVETQHSDYEYARAHIAMKTQDKLLSEVFHLFT